ncbi:methyltransferase regulatory domain-containing protein [Novosphingobium aquiterrae]|uniref:Methyltransferase regulatory domain-containing protein n=1 Tax=Novosphingobium aquiterrae TaxID=624388 RepID=A0ABV6PEG8_9SPHN
MTDTEIESAAGPGGHYETVPYDSMPFAHTQPANLAALATLFGLTPPPVKTARVLELGCASGGNIIPLAARFPEAQFTGIDLSARHVALGRARIAAAGLTNITLDQGDLAEPGLVTGTFDYIICHGVYSWAPPAAQQGILKIFGRNLSPAGLAYVSYNVLPGWRLRQVIRDIFCLHTDQAGGPLEQVAQGRALLERLAAASREETPYGQLLRLEAKQLAAMPDSYILGEFLSAENAPCSFGDFMARASGAGLDYLCDTDLHTALPQLVSPDMDQLVKELAGSDPVSAGQTLDFVLGRQFRQSLLCRTDNPDAIRRDARPERIAGLHFASELRLVPGESRDDALILRDRQKRTITTNDALVARTLDRLGAVWPETLPLADLLDDPAVIQGIPRDRAAERITGSLLRVIVSKLASMSAVPLKVGKAAADKPSAWPIARSELHAGQTWTTSQRHAPLRLDAVSAVLVPMLDGSNDRAALVSHLLRLIEAGRLDAALIAAAPGGDRTAKARQLIDRALLQLEQLALLEPN